MHICICTYMDATQWNGMEWNAMRTLIEIFFVGLFSAWSRNPKDKTPMVTSWSSTEPLVSCIPVPWWWTFWIGWGLLRHAIIGYIYIHTYIYIYIIGYWRSMRYNDGTSWDVIGFYHSVNGLCAIFGDSFSNSFGFHGMDSTTKTIALAAGVGKTDGWTTARVNENWDVACLPMGSDGWGWRGWNRCLKLLRGLTCINFKQLLGFDSGLIISFYIFYLRITDPHWSHWFRFRRECPHQSHLILPPVCA